MAIHNNDDDDDQVGISLLDREASTQDLIVRNRRAQPSSPLRFALSTTLLVLSGLACFYLWNHGAPAYTTLTSARKPHHKQIHVHNGSVVAAETELVRPLFGRKKEGAVDRFDLVASIYFKTRDDDIEYDEQEEDPAEEAGDGVAVNETVANSTSTGIASVASVDSMTRSRLRLEEEEGEEREWVEPEYQRLFSEPVMRGLDVSSSRSAVVKVALPPHVV